jgi:hypothetical protein
MTITWPTPLSASISRRTVLSANSVTERTSDVEVTAKVRMGVASGSSFMIEGDSTSVGKSAIAAPTFSRTSSAATLMSFSRTKVTRTWLTPSTEMLRSSSMPLMVLTADSILSLTSVSI